MKLSARIRRILATAARLAARRRRSKADGRRSYHRTYSALYRVALRCR